uniref:Retrotransposon Copia-like N-terminal domain-containing protein n=1 Tax=Nymphaea colorata TaxID=210225 RepID=A0A5K1GXC1_9MAGN
MYSQDLLRYVDGSSTPPLEKLNANSTEINLEYIKWKRSDQLALSWILSTVSESILTQIISYDTAREAWVALANAHAFQSNIHILQLKGDL